MPSITVRAIISLLLLMIVSAAGEAKGTLKSGGRKQNSKVQSMFQCSVYIAWVYPKVPAIWKSGVASCRSGKKSTPDMSFGWLRYFLMEGIAVNHQLTSCS